MYGPERDWMDGKRIVPGYLNASSWSAGKHGATVAHVRQEMEHRLKMMEIALELLNEYNQVVLDWETIENPFRTHEYEKNELERYRAEAKRQREEANKKAQEKEAKKKVTAA